MYHLALTNSRGHVLASLETNSSFPPSSLSITLPLSLKETYNITVVNTQVGGGHIGEFPFLLNQRGYGMQDGVAAPPLVYTFMPPGCELSDSDYAVYGCWQQEVGSYCDLACKCTGSTPTAGNGNALTNTKFPQADMLCQPSDTAGFWWYDLAPVNGTAVSKLLVFFLAWRRAYQFLVSAPSRCRTCCRCKPEMCRRRSRAWQRRRSPAPATCRCPTARARLP